MHRSIKWRKDQKVENQKKKADIDRRGFLHSAAVAGAGLVLSSAALGQTGRKKPDDINVALLGAGMQGKVLATTCLKIAGVRFKAVCDIWTAYNQGNISRLLKRFGHPNNAYVDYKQMLDKEKDLDAVIIATPDFRHAEHTVACLKAGLHVYCEKEMSNTLEGARQMVEAARQTGKLLQIGHQRRSNPRYIFCYEKLIKEANLLNRITTVNGQWNRSKAACEDLGFPKKAAIDRKTLEKYGFNSMHQFRNWRWYRGLGGGPIVDLGSHQIDIYSWFLGANPKSVVASGGTDYWKDHQWYDSVMAIYEYETKDGTVRALYQTGTTNSCQGYFESFMGDEATLLISEYPPSRCNVYREGWLHETKWDKWVKKGYLRKTGGISQPEKEDAGKSLLPSVRPPSVAPPKYDLLVKMDKLYHQPHLENFFEAIRSRGKVKLNCPAEVGYETAVAVLKVNEAVEAARKLEFKPEEFKV